MDILVETARRAIKDHSIDLSEMDSVRMIQRLFAIEDGAVLQFRRDDVADLIREAMERVLDDSFVNRRESRYKVALQEAFALSYDDFATLAREQHDAALRALLEKIDHDGRGLSYDRLTEFHVRAAHLDAVFQVDLLNGGDRDGSPGRYIPADVKNAVWRRDRGRCARCSSQERLEFDHIVPHSRGGSNTYRNVQLLCESCNRAKRAEIDG
ncbi:MAG: HNH endonuclease [Gemmatimonadales bacterium]